MRDRIFTYCVGIILAVLATLNITIWREETIFCGVCISLEIIGVFLLGICNTASED